ncbi:MAG: M12 family metallo-peptidase, partial [Nitrososphaerales archaeon]
MSAQLRPLTRHHRRLFTLVTLTLLLAALSFGSAGSAEDAALEQPGVTPLFLDLPLTTLGAEPAPPSPSIAGTRERLARVDLALLTDPQRNETLQLNLFDDVTIIAERRTAGPAYEDAFVWNGRVAGSEFSTVILVQVNDAVAGMVQDGAGQTYEIRYAGLGRSVIRQLDTTRFPDEAPPLEPPEGWLTETPAGAAPASPLADDSSRLDIMIVYTDDARAAAGGDSAMRAEVYLAVEVTNQAYVNSNVVQRLGLVHTSEIAYAETANSGTDLGRLQNTGDGQLDQVPVLRDRYGADLVTFLVNTTEGGVCGRGYVMTTVSTAFAPYAYNVVARDCASSNLSMAHELGHNMGGQHDWYVDAGTSPYSYAHGYVDVAHHWRTIMAYNSECDAQTPAVYCTRITYFSNPAVSYGGNPTGIAGGTNTSCTAGNLANPNCDADMRTTLNNTRSTVAAFRNTSPGRSDAWMKDTWEDTGGEPDAYTAGQDMWKSPYLWVRNAADPNRVYQHEHQNPINSVTNYVYTKLQNGSESTMAGTLRLYWAEAAAGLAWPVDWHNFANVPVTLPANSSQVAQGTWTPSGTGHYCLLARWDSAADPMHAEGAGVSANVRNNNNIIWKNVEVVPFTGPDCEKERPLPVIVRNVGNLDGKEVGQLDLFLRPSMETGENWLQYFDYVDLLPGALMGRWQDMAGFERVSETRLRLMDPKGGALLGVGMKYREEETVHVVAKTSCKSFPAALTNLGMEVVQIAEGDKEPVGGVSYAVSLQPQPSTTITVTGAKFNDRDKDGYWDEDGSEPPLAGWVIRAVNLKGDQQFSAVTDSTGRYQFELPRDIYTLSEVLQDGWVQTAPPAGQYQLDLRETAPGSTIHDLNFGNYQERRTGDLGDAPDNTNHFGSAMTAYPLVPARYPTVYGDPPRGGTRGPLHLQPRAQAWLGPNVSLEWDADLPPDSDIFTNLNPPANRANRDRFDDGLAPADLQLPDCAVTSFKYRVRVNVPIQRWYTNVWMDFNRDGDWLDKLECQSATGAVLVVPEWAVQNQVVTLAAGDFTLETPQFVSARSPSGRDPMWMRITLAEQTAPSPFEGSGPAGGYTYGETEDYLLGPARI